MTISVRPTDIQLEYIKETYVYYKGILYSRIDENGIPFVLDIDLRRVTAKNKAGYLITTVTYPDKTRRVLRAHNICWFLYYGEWPDKELDHRNRNKTNNKIKNLRKANGTLQQLNKNKNSSLPPGVSRNYNHFRARITVNGKRIGLGTYKTSEEAFEVVKTKYRELYEEDIDVKI